MFVANRVIEIQNKTDPQQWFYCLSSDNPAHLVTRGISASALVGSKLWLEGPSWLSLDKDQWPTSSDDEHVLSMLTQSELLVSCHKSQPVEIFEVERWGKYTKAIRIVAWVLRFINNVKHSGSKLVSEDLTYDEQIDARRCLSLQCQKLAFFEDLELLRKGMKLPKGSILFKLSPTIDEKGLLRVKGRLQHSEMSYKEKYPVILPKCHLF